jgi:23S rRNA A2030 N6-methylase RlmJ
MHQRHVPTPPDCSRVLCYIDPPYSGTTGYAHLFPREAVVAVARRWADPNQMGLFR